MILVDTSVWIDYFNGTSGRHTDALDHHLSHSRIIMGDLILTEVLQGFRSDSDFRKAKQFLDVLEFRQIGGYAVALESARIYRQLRKSGVTVRKTIDVLIGAFCIMEGLKLLHNDRDFDPIAERFPLNTVSSP
jgi:predicted nucleic acid-binding protein